jgi:hypothetical protein
LTSRTRVLRVDSEVKKGSYQRKIGIGDREQKEDKRMCIRSRSIGKKERMFKRMKGMEDKRAEINKLVQHIIPRSGDRTYSYTPWSKLRFEVAKIRGASREVQSKARNVDYKILRYRGKGCNG